MEVEQQRGMDDPPQRKKPGKQIGDFVLYNDGSFERAAAPAATENFPANPEFVDGVASSDVVLDEALGLWVRVFHLHRSPGDRKPPVVIYFHGGGFISLSAANSYFHRFCERLSRKLESVVVSVNYRLAPEHKLPAAYDDGYSVLEWIARRRSGGDGQQLDQLGELLASANADLSRIFVMGDSAGGNLAATVALRAARDGIELAGQILLQPFYGGVARTESETKLEKGPVITLGATDFCWRASLPEGADRDHPYCNPAVELPGQLADLGTGRLARALVVAGGMDLLHDRQVELAKILENAGQAVKLVEYDKAVHAFYVADVEEAALVVKEVANFVQA